MILSHLNIHDTERLAFCNRNIIHRVLGGNLIIDCSLEQPGHFSPELQFVEGLKLTYGKSKLWITARDIIDLNDTMDYADRWTVTLQGHPAEQGDVQERQDRSIAAFTH